MEPHGRDLALEKAMALALMRQALAILDGLEELKAGCHLQASIDALLRRGPLPPAVGNA